MIHQVKDTIYIYKSVCGWCLDEAETGIRVYVSDGIE